MFDLILNSSGFKHLKCKCVLQFYQKVGVRMGKVLHSIIFYDFMIPVKKLLDPNMTEIG